MGNETEIDISRSVSFSNTLSPLTLEENDQDKSQQKQEITTILCFQCDKSFNFPHLKDDYLAHLFLEHRLVIADVDDIGDLEDYLMYWSNEFKKGYELREYCTTILLDQLPDGTPSKNERYYLLSDILPKDYTLRKELHSKRLEKVLTQYQIERSDRTFCRECLYCRDIIKGLRAEYIEHLFNKHFLQLGKSENLIYIDELLDCVQKKLDNLICIFCEKTFKDRGTLKEHMRKKGHKRINPDIKFYDKFYLENYKIEKPKHVKNMKGNINKQNLNNLPNQNRSKSKIRNNAENETSVKSQKLYDDSLKEKPQENNANEEKCFISNNNSDENDSDWSDWDGEQIQLVCFFCSMKDTDFNCLKMHMLDIHNFDFDISTKSLAFYQKIKVVNYIRRQMHILHCIMCDENYKTLDELRDHMEEMKHFSVGHKKQWDRPEYFFPTYDDDGILCLLDDIDNKEDDNIDDGQISVVIISEDLKATINKDAEALSMENFKI